MVSGVFAGNESLWKTCTPLQALVPVAVGKALQEAAKEPKRITWYESDHVGIDIEQTKHVLEEGLKWLIEQDDQFRPTEERGKALPPFDIDRGLSQGAVCAACFSRSPRWESSARIS